MKRIISCLLSVVLIVSALFFSPVSFHRVYADSDNLALGKPSSASSTMSPYLTSYINDGNYKSIWVRGNYAVQGEWIQVDLESTYILTSVVLHNRIDAVGEGSEMYRTRVDVYFSNDPTFATYDKVVAMTDKDPGYGVPVEIKPPKRAYRYIRAVKSNTSIFVLAELEAYGYPSTATGDAPPEYLDIPGTEYETSVNMLASLCGVRGMNDEEFGVHNLLRRDLAADMLARAFVPTFDDEKEYIMPFTDVANDNPFRAGIAMAYEMGYIRGDGTGLYHPDSYVTRDQFATMIARAMGYEQKLSYSPSYAAGVQSIARELGLFDGITRDDTMLSAGDAAIILKNALLAPQLEISSISEKGISYTKSEDLFGEILYNMTVYEGIVNETGEAKLNGDTKSTDTTAVIGSTKLADPDGKLNDYLGKNVMVWAKANENDKVFIVLDNGETEEITIAAENVSKATTSYVEMLDENDKTKKYNLSSGVDVVYNGSPYPGFKASELMPARGSITLINNDGDSDYDVVFVDEYEVLRVHGASAGDKYLSIIDEKANHLKYEVDTLTVRDKDGFPAMVSGVKQGVVLKVFKAKNSPRCRIIIFSKSNAAGEVTEKATDSLTIGDITYNYAFGYQDSGADNGVGSYVYLYLDENGEIIYITEDDVKNDGDWEIGFCITNVRESGLSGKLKFKIFTQNKTFITPYVADKLEVDGVRMTASEFATKLTNDSSYADYFTTKLLRYKLNSKEELSTIDSQDKGNESGITFVNEGHIGTAVYWSATQSFWEVNKFMTMAASNTPVFIIPMEAGTVSGSSPSYTTDSAYDSLYDVRPLISVTTDRGSMNQDIDMYMRNEAGYPTCFMRSVAYSGVTSGEGVTTVNSASASFMVAKRVSIVDEGYKVMGIDLSTGKEVSFVALNDVKLIESGLIYGENDGDAMSIQSGSWFLGQERRIDANKLNTASSSEKAKYISNVSEIRTGDILRYELAGGTARAVERVFEYNPSGDIPIQKLGVWLSVEGANPQFIVAYYRFQFAEFKGVIDNVAVFDVNGQEERYEKTKFANIYSIDEVTNALVRESIDALYGYMDENCRTMIFAGPGGPVSIVVYKYEK